MISKSIIDLIYRKLKQLKEVKNMQVTLLLGSSREASNCELLANIVVKGLDVTRVYLKDYNIQPIKDLRHSPTGFQTIKDDHSKIMTTLLKTDVLIFATPIYWYSMSGIMKNFIDRLSQTIRDPSFQNVKKKLSRIKTIVLAVGGDTPRIKGLPLILQFQYTFDFLNMELIAYILGEGNQPGEILNDIIATSEAEHLNSFLQGLLPLNEL